jgi:hypothetical protein
METQQRSMPDNHDAVATMVMAHNFIIIEMLRRMTPGLGDVVLKACLNQFQAAPPGDSPGGSEGAVRLMAARVRDELLAIEEAVKR